MTPDRIAARFANNRPGMELVDFIEVGLPSWKVLARCEVLAKKPLSAIDETILKCLTLDFKDVPEIQIMLGLDEIVLTTSITSLIQRGWVTGSGHDSIEPTESGQEILAKATEVESRELVIPFHYDGLLRRPITQDSSVSRKEGLRLGLKEIPPSPDRKPDVSELRTCRQELSAVLRNMNDRREQESQLLTIHSIDRGDRYMIPAIALTYAPSGKGRCEVCFVVDDEASPDHEAAFVAGSLQMRFGLDRNLRGTTRRKLPLRLPAGMAVEDLDLDSEARARTRLRELEEESERGRDVRNDLVTARKALAGIAPRTVQPGEHRQLLETAIALSKKRLLLAGGKFTSRVLDAGLVRSLRKTLDSGTVAILHLEAWSNEPESTHQALRDLAAEYENLTIKEVDEFVGRHVLLSDDRFVVSGHFPWGAYLGDSHRPIADHRSILQTDRVAIDSAWHRFYSDPKTKPKRGKAKSSRHARRGKKRGDDHQRN